MKESFPSQDKNDENEWLLRDAEYVVNAMWEKAMDVGNLPLSVDPSYQVWLEDLGRRKNDFARILFNKARETNGEEKLRYAQILQRLMKILDNTSRLEILKELLTTEETILELVRQAEKQVRSTQRMPERVKGRFRKAVDRLLHRDDDFDDDLK